MSAATRRSGKTHQHLKRRGCPRTAPFFHAASAAIHAAQPQFMPHRGNSRPQSGQFILGRTEMIGAPEEF
jgi:hypothetical protein